MAIDLIYPFDKGQSFWPLSLAKKLKLMVWRQLKMEGNQLFPRDGIPKDEHVGMDDTVGKSFVDAFLKLV